MQVNYIMLLRERINFQDKKANAQDNSLKGAEGTKKEIDIGDIIKWAVKVRIIF